MATMAPRYVDRAKHQAIASYREQADRLQAIAIDLFRAGDPEKSKEAARYADIAFRAAINERINREPAGLACNESAE